MQLAQDIRHVVVKEEVVAGGPLGVNLASHQFDRRTRPAHSLDDSPREVDEQLRVVLARPRIEQRARGRNRSIECGRVDVDAVTGAEITIAIRLKRWTRLDQGEVDVEEDSAGRTPGDYAGHAAPSGPATATLARSG